MFAAVSAYDQAGKRIPSGEASGRWNIFCCPLCDFGLHRFVVIHADDGLVRSLSMVHRELAIVDHGLFRQMVFPEGPLKEKVSGVGVISEDAADAGFTPISTVSGFHTVCVQALSDGDNTLAGKELPENAADRFGFVRLDDVNAIPVAVAEEGPVPRLALLAILTHTPSLIFAGRKALLLCIGRKDRKHQFSVSGKGVDVLLLEKDVNSEGFQIPDRLQQCDRIPGKAGYGFCDNHIDLSGLAIGYEPNEALSCILCASLGFVRIHADILPAGMLLDQATVIADLR